MKTKMAIEICTVTLVGIVVIKYPVLNGNCFSVKTNDDKYFKVVNFCYENFLEVIKRGVSWPIKIGMLGDKTAIIHDERIPDEWYSGCFCEVCCPEHLLPLPQKLRHERQESRGERTVSGSGCFINYKKVPVLKKCSGCN